MSILSDSNRAQWLQAQLETWRRLAPDYSKLTWVRNQELIDHMIEFCEPRQNWVTLDIGTGHGTIAAALESRVARVIGIDIAPEMITESVDRHGHVANLSFAVGNVEELDFPDNMFDLATARMVFHHVGDCSLGVAQVWRVLKPGGRFVLCEGVPPDHLTRSRYEQIFALKEKRHTFSEAELINLFDRAHFEDILLRPYFMRQVSLNNWLAYGALEPHVVTEIRRLHIEADDHFKRVYRLTESDGDLFMDWKFVLIRGRKPVAPSPGGDR